MQPDERLERPGGADDPSGLPALVVRQHDDGAVGLEEAPGVPGDLVDDAVELDGLGEDVAQLLEEKSSLIRRSSWLASCSDLVSDSRSRRRPRVMATQKLPRW